ncbi:cleavage polyadenylation factor subunit fip1, variant 3 [Entomophthora muscae]|uniref:Cleavage polyadenylation factor subunit fip1, variant 3 n=1 Tax=Entomophthora muscae TaxID=34485 RepID=A0ACC2UM15_9FUNG|nr:cleavage polyadenylation factor subunit fip1, variant 3 [Entomophthora muscae]
MDDDDLFLYGDTNSSPHQNPPEAEPEDLVLKDSVECEEYHNSDSHPSVIPEVVKVEVPADVVRKGEASLPEPLTSFEVEVKQPTPENLPQLDASTIHEISESDDESIDIILEVPPEGETTNDTNREGLVHLKVTGEGRAPTKVNENKAPGLDLDAVAYYDGEPLFDIQLEDFDEKPWRKPGADLTDYFNYGFDERSWMLYCQRQQQLRDNGNHGSNSGQRSYGANHQSPRRYESSFKRPMQSGAIQVVAGSERERDSGLGDGDDRHHQRHGGRNSQSNRALNDFSGSSQFSGGNFPNQPMAPNALPALSYSLNGPSVQTRGGPTNIPPGFNPVSGRASTSINPRAQSWRDRSQSPNHSDGSPQRNPERPRDYRPRNNRRNSRSRSPPRDNSPHRLSKPISSRHLSKSPSYERTRDVSKTRERRHSHRDGNDHALL